MARVPLDVLFSRDPILKQFSVGFRRAMNEGFGGFLISISLFTAGAFFITFYLHDKIALENAVRAEILNTVGTRQEPTDVAKELGLIGSALARVNAGSDPTPPIPREWSCQVGPPCTPADKLPEELAARFMNSVNSELKTSDHSDWEDATYDVPGPKDNPASLSWPELGDRP